MTKRASLLYHDSHPIMRSFVILSTYALIWLLLSLSVLSCSRETVVIDSYILRNRVVLLDRVSMKKALYVAFSLSETSKQSEQLRAVGTLRGDNSFSAQSLPGVIEGKSGNLVFDLPYQIPDGMYTIRIEISDSSGKPAAHGSLAIDRSALRNTVGADGNEPAVALQESVSPREQDALSPTADDLSKGYILFSRSPLEYIYPESRPRSPEVIDRITISVVQNEFEPITFALYPLRHLGTVTVGVSNLHGSAGMIAGNKVRIGYIEPVKETRGMPEGKYGNLPSLIRPGNRATVEEKKCCRFWLTLNIDQNVLPGTYTGNIIITPQFGKVQTVPLRVEVSALSLTDIPGKDYFMLMTYEFTELTMPGTKQERAAIYRSAVNIVKDYKNHGITTLCIHSPFVFITKEDGTQNLNDLFAALRAAKDSGFTRPIIWYMGHLIQTSKPRHPGNIRSFDEQVDLPRLRRLVKSVMEYAKSQGYPDVIFLPIDEPDDSSQDVHDKRRKITSVLLRTIHDAGGKTMITSRSFSQFGPVDFIGSGEISESELRAAHKSGGRYWAYNNRVTEACNNPAYARYIYGYYAWKSNIDGMSSWTFQNTQNASGPPASMGGIGRDAYLAYPDPEGPLATLIWEAIREGIDDHKLMYQLGKRIAVLKNKGLDATKYEYFFAALRKRLREPGCTLEDLKGWQPAEFDRTRADLINLITHADRRLAASAVVQ